MFDGEVSGAMSGAMSEGAARITDLVDLLSKVRNIQ